MARYTSDDYKRFLASAPAAQREYRTITLSHSALAADYHFVQDDVDQTLGGVTYTAIAMQITEPAENRDGDAVLSVSLGAVGDEVQEIISQISGTDYLTPVSCVYRKFYSGDTSTPVLTLSLSVSTLNFNSYTSVSFSAEDVDFANKTSGEYYSIERFPMLAAV